MIKDAVQLAFNIIINPEHFNERVDEILNETYKQLPEAIVVPEFTKKCRWITTELITNAYKHSGQQEIDLKIRIQPDELHIIKEDNGIPLTIHLPNGEYISWPLDTAHYNREVNIFHDKLNILNARITEEGSAEFYVNSDTPPSAMAEDMNEHFGLIIIAGVSDLFKYCYEADHKKNTFTSVIRYRTA